MLLYVNSPKGDYYLLLIFLKKRNPVNQMPDKFFEFVGEFLRLEPKLNCRLPESTLEKLERALIANFYHCEYLRLKSHSQSRFNDWNTTYFEVSNIMENYKQHEKQKQIELDRQLRNLARNNKT
jgi:hypothetical protein